MQSKLRKEATTILTGVEVDYFVGYESACLRWATTPVILTTKDTSNIERLVINPFINHNLANYLTQLKGRIAVVAKGCDSRSIVSLIQDKQIKREDVIIIGIPCAGLIDVAKVEKATGRSREEIDEIVLEGDSVRVRSFSESRIFPASELLQDNCMNCELPTPQEFNIMLGEPGLSPVESVVSSELLKKLSNMSPDNRWLFWREEFKRCIRCYACRNVCPSCFCKRCFVEETEPQWLLPLPHWQDNLMFQITRTIHTAGRCSDCGGCDRACPVGIPLRAFTRSMADVTYELFNFKSGMDTNAKPLMTAYELAEAEDLIK